MGAVASAITSVVKSVTEVAKEIGVVMEGVGNAIADAGRSVGAAFQQFGKDLENVGLKGFAYIRDGLRGIAYDRTPRNAMLFDCAPGYSGYGPICVMPFTLRRISAAGSVQPLAPTWRPPGDNMQRPDGVPGQGRIYTEQDLTVQKANFFVFSTGNELERMTGTVAECQQRCNQIKDCSVVERSKSINNNASGLCILKQNGMNRFWNGPNKSFITDGWRYNDFMVYTTSSSDLPGQPMWGTLAECKASCNSNGACVGFAREKNAHNDHRAQCYLKQNITNNPRKLNDSVWQTWTNDR